MMAVYGVDTLDPSISLRKIKVLSERLPAGSMPRVDRASWSFEAHLLARLNDAIDLLTWIMLRVNGDKRTAKPEPLERPGQSKPRGQQMKWGELGTFLKAQGVTNGR